MSRMKYKFSHQNDGVLYWYSTTFIPGTNRIDKVFCSAKWFYGMMTTKENKE